jgi:hypothetical protein
MEKKNQKLLLLGLIGLLVIASLIFLASTLFSGSKIGERISPIQIIKFSDENSSITITKNNLDKTASLDMAFYMDANEMQNEFMDLTQFTTEMMCGMMVLAFFDPEGLEEFNQQIQEWNSMEGVVENEKGEEQGTPEGNILEGYTIKKVKVAMQDSNTKKLISDCTIIGKEENDISVNYY